MAENKTQATQVNPLDFQHAVEPERRRADGLRLLEIFERATGFAPRMWGPRSSASDGMNIATRAGGRGNSSPRASPRERRG